VKDQISHPWKKLYTGDNMKILKRCINYLITSQTSSYERDPFSAIGFWGPLNVVRVLRRVQEAPCRQSAVCPLAEFKGLIHEKALNMRVVGVSRCITHDYSSPPFHPPTPPPYEAYPCDRFRSHILLPYSFKIFRLI
jgi:hypothetical protein